MATTWTARPSASSGNKRTLIIAIVFGLLSAFLIFTLLNNAGGKTTTSVGVPVVVAKADIPARTVVTDSMLSLSHIPDNLKLLAAVTDQKLAVGKLAKVDIAANEQIVTTKLVDSPDQLGFAGQVPDGFRAISILASEVTTGGGLISPGDFADVIGIFLVNDKDPQLGGLATKPDGNSGGRVVAATVLQNVKVLAIAQQINADPTVKPASGKATTAKAQPEAHSVTLAVTPENAARLALADQMGTLRLSLHGVNNPDPQPIAQVDNSFASLFGAAGTSSAPPAPQATAAPKK